MCQFSLEIYVTINHSDEELAVEMKKLNFFQGLFQVADEVVDILEAS